MQKKNRWHLNLTFPVGKCCLFSCPQNHNFWGNKFWTCMHFESWLVTGKLYFQKVRIIVRSGCHPTLLAYALRHPTVQKDPKGMFKNCWRYAASDTSGKFWHVKRFSTTCFEGFGLIFWPGVDVVAVACGSHMHGSVAWQSCGGQQNEQGKMGPNFTSMHSCVKSWAGSCEWYVWSYAARKREEAGRLIFCRSGLRPWPKIPTKGSDTGSMLRCLWVWAWIYA